ncbi:MAG: thiolase domain-containing protein, partial [Verrucomicrobia bacterium]|nr:thiolase domain-containing protein [Verrucomicrobiota bacterium]
VIVEIGREALKATGVPASDIQAGLVGNFAGGQYTKQQHFGAFLCEIDDALRGIPTIHTEAACASGSLAVLTGAQWIMAGLYDCVLVVGAEQQKTMSPLDGSDVLGAAADYHAEKPIYGDYMFPKLFGAIAEQYFKRYPNTTEAALARVAVKNYAHAKLNPLAQMRDASLDFKTASTESQANWRIATSPLKLYDCSQITDGAAAVMLCSERYLEKRHSAASSGSQHSTRNAQPAVRLLGWGHSTDCLALEKKDVPAFPQARKAVQAALDRAGIRDPKTELHGIDVHDCFSISELIAYETIGLAAPGEGASLLPTGATMHPGVRGLLLGEQAPAPPFSIPVNAGGGLMADGHPVGATGVRQVLDAYKQLTGNAGAMQIEGAKRFLTYNVGGSITTAVVMVWEH